MKPPILTWTPVPRAINAWTSRGPSGRRYRLSECRRGLWQLGVWLAGEDLATRFEDGRSRAGLAAFADLLEDDERFRLWMPPRREPRLWT